VLVAPHLRLQVMALL
jgi:hypothetical protein